METDSNIIALGIIKWLLEHAMEVFVVIAIAINTVFHYYRIRNDIFHNERLEERLIDINNKLRPLTDINNKLRKLQKKIPSNPKETTDRYGWEFRNMRRMIHDLLAYGFVAEEIKEMLDIDTKVYWNHTGRKRH